MSIKKRIKAGRIDPSADGTAIIVHYTTEITHFDEDGAPTGVEKIPDKKEVPVGKAIRRARVEDLPDLAQELADRCKYIPQGKLRQVEQALAKLLAAPPQPPRVPSATPQPQQLEVSTPPHTRSRLRKGARSDRHGDHHSNAGSGTPTLVVLPRPADVLPEAHMDSVDDYADELYEEKMEAKAGGAQRLLRLCVDVKGLEEISEHVTLLGVLSRELRENAKRSHELAVAITGIFMCLAHFSQFHPALSRHQCGEATMRVMEYEGKRVKALQKELKLAQARIVARGSLATAEEQHRLEREELRYKAVVERQDRLLQLCVFTLRDLSEDTAVEQKFVAQRVCHHLIPLLGRSSEELLLGVVGFLHKLSAFEQNKDQIVQSTDAVSRLADLAGHSSNDVALLALRLCYNISFDASGRAVLAQSSLLGRLPTAFQLPQLRPISLKLLYHLSMDVPLKAIIANRFPSCVGLALQQVVRGKERSLERDAVALSINLAADEACAAVMLETNLFSRLVHHAIHHCDALMLKIVRHVASHKNLRQKMFRAMDDDSTNNSRSDGWLFELTRLAVRCSDRPEGLVEVLGILANLDCPSPEVPWPELCSSGLLDLMHRLLMVGFSEDDVLLECITLAGVLALDYESAPLIAASKLPTMIPLLLTEKQDDDEIIVQLLHTVRCLLLQEETCEVVVNDTDTPERILDILEAIGVQPADAKAQAVQAIADQVLDLFLALEEQDSQEPQWTDRIRAYRFEVHNHEWIQSLQHGDHPKESSDRKASDTRSTMRWTDVGGLADRCWGTTVGGMALR